MNQITNQQTNPNLSTGETIWKKNLIEINLK